MGTTALDPSAFLLLMTLVLITALVWRLTWGFGARSARHKIRSKTIGNGQFLPTGIHASVQGHGRPSDPMDGTPQLLTNIQFGEAKKGYYRDQVDNFLRELSVKVGELQDMLRETAQRAEAAEAQLADATKAKAQAERDAVQARAEADAAKAEASAAPATGPADPDQRRRSRERHPRPRPEDGGRGG